MKKKMNLNINIQQNNAELSFYKKMSSKEEILLDEILMNQKKILEGTLVLSKKRLMKILNITDEEKILKIISRLSSNFIIYTTWRFDLIDRQGGINIVSSYLLEEKQLTLNFSNDFMLIFKKSSYYNNYSFDKLISLRGFYSNALFLLFKNSISLNRTFEISLLQLKKILDLEGVYSRFYDFEMKILIPNIKKVEKAISKKISYKRIKNKNAFNSKIIGLHFNITDTHDQEYIDMTNNLISFIKKGIIYEKNVVWNIIHNSLEEKTFDYIKRNIIYCNLHLSKKQFSTFLYEALKYDYFKNRYKNKIRKYRESYKELRSIEKTFTSLGKLHSEVFKILVSLKFNYLTINPNFLKALQSLKKNNEFEYFDNNYIIFVEFNIDGDSYINIFES